MTVLVVPSTTTVAELQTGCLNPDPLTHEVIWYAP
jgi:hypothetical protein